MNNEPNVLIWDIETGYNVATIFSLLNHNMLPASAIINERYIISGAFKRLGMGGAPFSVSLLGDINRFKKDPTDDKYVVTEIHKILSEADAIVAHYGDNFDIKFFNTRAVFHGLDPLPPIIQIDTYKIAKSKFKFNSNRLDYIGKFLGLGGKIHTTWELWLRCLNGNRAAVKEMVKYNKQDVALLEKVYQKLAPYVPAKVNRALYHAGEVCALCSSPNIHPRGYTHTRTRTYRRFKCGDCSHWTQSTRCEPETTAQQK